MLRQVVIVGAFFFFNLLVSILYDMLKSLSQRAQQVETATIGSKILPFFASAVTTMALSNYCAPASAQDITSKDSEFFKVVDLLLQSHHLTSATEVGNILRTELHITSSKTAMLGLCDGHPNQSKTISISTYQPSTDFWFFSPKGSTDKIPTKFHYQILTSTPCNGLKDKSAIVEFSYLPPFLCLSYSKVANAGFGSRTRDLPGASYYGLYRDGWTEISSGTRAIFQWPGASYPQDPDSSACAMSVIVRQDYAFSRTANHALTQTPSIGYGQGTAVKR